MCEVTPDPGLSSSPVSGEEEFEMGPGDFAANILSLDGRGLR
jgi:hypothetical protein